MKTFVPITEYRSVSKSFNATTVDDAGSPTTTQIWGGGMAEVSSWILGNLSRSKVSPFDRRPVHAYIYSHLGGKTCFIDLDNPKHFAALKAIAAQQNKPTKEKVCQTS